MPRLIDADKLIEDVRKNSESYFADDFAKEWVDKQPTVEQPEIIRCRDCRYWQDNNGGYPHDECRWNKDETPNEDDYCSYAERREVSE